MLLQQSLLLGPRPGIFVVDRLFQLLLDLLLLLLALGLGLLQSLLRQPHQLFEIHAAILFQLPQQLVLPRPQNDLIVDVRGVDLIQDIVVKIIRHDPPHDVERQIRPGVTHVRRVVHGGAAGVPADVAVLHGDEGFFLVGERVAEKELAEGDGVGGGGVGLRGQPRVAVGRVGGGAAWWAEGAGSGEGHGVPLRWVALAGCLIGLAGVRDVGVGRVGLVFACFIFGLFG
mmetsp:Transcript_25755/g.49949  ORF Transcript_25755/g.49949 Transcript_25755/m.49949 type:complete len:229 (-) Transcript_25755:11-697(-)